MLSRAATAFLLVAMFVEPETAHAYTRRDVLTATAACIGESGWMVTAEECQAITWIHLYRASLPAHRGRSLAAVTRLYSSALNGRRPWVVELSRGHWPRSLPSWKRERWERLLRVVEHYLKEPRPPECNGLPTNYGSRSDGPPDCNAIRVCTGRQWESVMWQCMERPAWMRPRRGRPI